MADENLELDDSELADWHAQGFTITRGLIAADRCEAQYDAAIELSRSAATGSAPDAIHVVAEGRPRQDAAQPEDFVAKLFRLHRLEPYRSFAHDPAVLGILTQLLGTDVDLFLSQFIFKAPSAYGQPWHQDSYYFPFSESHQVGVWLAVTRATVRNGCLWVVPGTHRDPIHEHVPDDRPNATHAYTGVPDVDQAAAVPVEMSPGDVLFFDSHLLHSSTDNASDEVRAAFVCHYARAGTIDRTPPDRSVNDWVPALRAGIAP